MMGITVIAAGGTKYDGYIDYFKALGDKSLGLDRLKDIIAELLLKINE